MAEVKVAKRTDYTGGVVEVRDRGAGYWYPVELTVPGFLRASFPDLATARNVFEWCIRLPYDRSDLIVACIAELEQG